MATISSPTPLTPAQLAAMDVNQRRAYFSQLPANQQASQQAAWSNYRDQMNRNYMRTTIRQYAVCPPQSGNALSQNYSSATQLTYNVPTAENAFLEGFIFRCALTVNCATGSSATYALNAAAPLNVIQEIDVIYGNMQMRFRPYILKYLNQITGYLNPIEPGIPPVAGQTIAAVQNYLTSLTYNVATGNNTWNLEFRIPFNILNDEDVRGMLPIMNGETTCQVNVLCANAPMSNDPILSPVSAASGTGNAVTITGTVQVIAYYRNGISLLGPARQGLDISGIPTIQWDIDPPLNNLLAGSIFRQKINKAETIAIAILTLVDANSSTKFASLSNIQELELGKDSSGTNKFWQFGIGTNLNVLEYFAEQRRIIGQDLDEGIIVLVNAPIWNVPSPANNTGVMYLNTQPSGWTDVNYGLQVSSINGVAGVNARVECHLIYINPVGLIAG